jgi:hypothetical protein
MDSPAESWTGILRFYDGFRDIEGWGALISFRQLVVARLAESDWGRRLWASQSHEVLLISRVGTWPERVERPRVIVMPRECTVRIRRYGAAGEHRGEAELSFKECWPAVEAALSWLEAADAEPGTALDPAT